MKKQRDAKYLTKPEPMKITNKKYSNEKYT